MQQTQNPMYDLNNIANVLLDSGVEEGLVIQVLNQIKEKAHSRFD